MKLASKFYNKSVLIRKVVATGSAVKLIFSLRHFLYFFPASDCSLVSVVLKIILLKINSASDNLLICLSTILKSAST